MSEKRIEIEDYFIDFKFWNQRPVVTWLPGSSETILRFELRRASWSIQHGTLRSRKLVSIPLPQHTADQHDSLERLYSIDQHSSVKNVADGQEDEPAIDASDHRCPGCDCALKYSQRYPDFFCTDCLSLAEDADGRRLQFGNMGPMGGFYWSLDGALDGKSETTHENSDPVKCLISGRQAIVVEARFGGVVAQPVDSKGGASWVKGKLVDLTRKSP
ncbi:hypothetical protein [Rubripirellula tenax]|nr:hypothetical protein [Rubripirellula tenax]